MQFYLRLPSDPRVAVEKLGQSLQQVKDWMRVHNKREVFEVGSVSVLVSGCTCNLVLEGVTHTLLERSGSQLGCTPGPSPPARQAGVKQLWQVWLPPATSQKRQLMQTVAAGLLMEANE